MAKQQRGKLKHDEKERLRINWELLNTELDGKYLVDTMFQRGIFTDDDMEEVRHAVPTTRKGRTEVFLQKLFNSGVNGYGVFLEALKKSGYQHVAEKLEKTVVPPHIEQGPDQCSMCKIEGKSSPATHWCSEYQASMCSRCLKLHSSKQKNYEVVRRSGSDSIKKVFMCDQHGERMTLYCRNCNKPVCNVCSDTAHRTCKEVFTIRDQLTEVKSRLQERQHNLSEKIESTNFEITSLDVQTNKLLDDRSSMESEIRKTIKVAIDTPYQKEDQLIKKVNEQIEQDREKLGSMKKTKQIDLQMYQQQSQFIQQTLELEDEAQLFEMYLSSGSEAGADVTVTQRKDRTGVADISFIYDLETLKKQKEMINAKIYKMMIQEVNNINLTVSPALDEVIDTKLNVGDSSWFTDGLIMNIAGTKVTVFADHTKQRLTSFYTRGGQSFSSVLKVSGGPWCLTVISEGKVAVSFFNSQRIITVAVTPDLELLSTILTSKRYRGLSALDQSTLVAGSYYSHSVDLIDMKVNILKTFKTLPVIRKSFIDPIYIHVTRQGNILVSDYGMKSVICLTRSGDIVFTYTPTGDRALIFPWGITSTSTGDILVSDYAAHKVIHLSESGEFIRDILTAEDGLHNPTGLCVDGDKLCVTLYFKGLHKYRFS